MLEQEPQTRMFGVLAILLVLGGASLALYGPAIFSLGGWLASAILILFAFIGRRMILQEEKNRSYAENGTGGLAAGCDAQMKGYHSQIYEMHSLPGRTQSHRRPFGNSTDRE
jgi:hypothetical protein